jgi:hypothetical protein
MTNLRSRIEQLELHTRITNEGIAGDEKLSAAAWESLMVSYGPEATPEQNRSLARAEEPPSWSEILATVERVYEFR